MNRHLGAVLPAPRVLGMDEKKLRGRMRGIVTDIGLKKVFTITEDDGDALYSYLEQMPDLDNKGAPLPDDLGMGWVYLTMSDFRRAR